MVTSVGFRAEAAGPRAICLTPVAYPMDEVLGLQT